MAKSRFWKVFRINLNGAQGLSETTRQWQQRQLEQLPEAKAKLEEMAQLAQGARACRYDI